MVKILTDSASFSIQPLSRSDMPARDHSILDCINKQNKNAIISICED